MAVKIRLTRLGSKKNAHYRVVVIDSHSPRDGKSIETIGRYVPQADPSVVEIDTERARVGIASPSFYLLRPDGHVGLCGGSLERTDVLSYLRENVKLAADDLAIGPSSEPVTGESR